MPIPKEPIINLWESALEKFQKKVAATKGRFYLIRTNYGSYDIMLPSRKGPDFFTVIIIRGNDMTNKRDAMKVLNEISKTPNDVADSWEGKVIIYSMEE